MFVQPQTFVLGLKCLWARSRVHLDQPTDVKAVTCLVYAAGAVLLHLLDRCRDGNLQGVICHALAITLRNPSILLRIAFTQTF